MEITSHAKNIPFAHEWKERVKTLKSNVICSSNVILNGNTWIDLHSFGVILVRIFLVEYEHLSHLRLYNSSEIYISFQRKD
jgi:hypothetical protein